MHPYYIVWVGGILVSAR